MISKTRAAIFGTARECIRKERRRLAGWSAGRRAGGVTAGQRPALRSRVYTLEVHPEIQELQVKLKEILYDCAVNLKATKAALYLLDQPASRFELIAEYGFKGTARPSADSKNPIVDRCEKTRTPFFVNGLTVEPRFSEILFEAQTDRLLVAPIYLRGHLVGVLDTRDKAGKAPFEVTDLQKVQRVADRVAELFANKNVFGQRFITLSGNEPLPQVLTGIPQTAPPRMPTPVAVPVPPPEPAASYVPPVSSLILDARTAVERIRHAPAGETLSEAEMKIVHEILHAVLLIPGAIVAVFTAFGHLGGVQEFASRAMLTEEAIDRVQSKINSWLAKHGESAGTVRNHLQAPAGTTGSAITGEAIKKVFTAPIAAGSMRNLYLTVAFSNQPERNTHELLAAFHQQLQLAIEQSIGRRTANAGRLRIVEKIVEPDFSRFPELRRHSNAVVARTDAFARFLALTAAEIETARIVALVHDAGMRLLDYDRIYRKRDLSPDDLSILREHPTVGAALVEPLLGPEIARVVLFHHETFDGRGYPSQIAGDEIPLLSRILQVCDVYEAMIAVDNYQPPLSHDAAMAVITRGAGTQFDPDLIRRFEEMMRK
jgi:HD-GYP domain-containing protein (c-di-GMP phosphodiesterase class II)